MADKELAIRKYEKSPAEDKLVKFTIGLTCMEGLARSNWRGSSHPLAIVTWFAVSTLLAQVFDLWPKTEFGWVEYMRPVPIYACSVLPIVFLMDWFNRPYFEDLTQKVLLRPDVNAVGLYYTRSAASGFWFLHYGKKMVGLIAIDASVDSLSDEPVTSKPVKEALKLIKAKGTAHVATIRHFYIDELYRKTGIQEDLLTHAVEQAFKNGKAVETIRITVYPWASYLNGALKQAGFEFVEKGAEKFSVLGWRSSTYELSREAWETKRKGSKQE